MAASTVLYQRDGRIARITLNRPEMLNAINDAIKTCHGTQWWTTPS
jgi:enoyl-CoA hydratase/carnithine racemase